MVLHRLFYNNYHVVCVELKIIIIACECWSEVFELTTTITDTYTLEKYKNEIDSKFLCMTSISMLQLNSSIINTTDSINLTNKIVLSGIIFVWMFPYISRLLVIDKAVQKSAEEINWIKLVIVWVNLWNNK